MGLLKLFVVASATLGIVQAVHAAPAAKDPGGWGKYRWGMSFEEVLRLSGGVEDPLSYDADAKTRWPRAIYGTHVRRQMMINQIPTDVIFDIGCGRIGLYGVTLYFERPYFGRAEAAFIKQYGKPKRNDPLEFESFGDFPTTEISLILPNVDAEDMGATFEEKAHPERGCKIPASFPGGYRLPN